MSENTKKIEYGQLKPLRDKGKIINKWCHFTRNNPRTLNYYYNWVISLFGYDNWNKGSAPFKQAWDSAKYSFDMMYGLVKAWCAAKADLILELPVEDEKDIKISTLEEKLENIQRKMDEMEKEYEKALKEEKEKFGKAIEELDRAAEVVRKAKSLIVIEKPDEKKGD